VTVDGDILTNAIPGAVNERRSDVVVALGRALDWHEAGYGTYVDGVAHVFASREIDAIAGSHEINTEGAATLWEYMHTAAFRVLSAAAFLPDCDGLELRYVADPRLGEPTRLRMFVTAKTLCGSPEAARDIVETACAALPPGFSGGLPHDGPRLGDTAGRWAGDVVIELRRHEEVTAPQWNFVPTEFYYTINDDPGDGSGWPAFWSLFAQASQPVEVSVLFRATDVDWEERNVLARITSDLALYGNPHTDYDVFGNQVQYPADTNAAIALESWNRRIGQLQRPLLARVAVRGKPDVALSVASALATAIGGTATSGNRAHPMYIEPPDVGSAAERLAFEAYDWLEIFPWGGAGLWDMEDAPKRLRRLPYLYGINEAAGLAVLPIPDEQGVPGFPRARRNVGRRAAISVGEADGSGLALGALLHQGQSAGDVRVPLTAINRHVLIVGTPGSGKTTTVHTLLADLWREHRIPFLAIEPTKTEYRGLLQTPGMDDLAVISLGRDDLSPLRLNPLAPPQGVRREVHAGAVMAALKLAMPLFPPLPQLVEAALDQTYTLAGWGYDTTSEEGLTPPTLRDLLASFDVVFEREGYVGEARNIAAAFRVRLKGLLQGSRGRVLDTVESVNFADLMTRPVVIELDELSDGDDKAVLAAFVLDRIRAAARERGSTGGQLRHVTVLEEAHRVLARDDEHGTANATGDNTRAHAVRAFCEAMRELRAQGEGFILSSQRPSDLAESALATTSTRILHRLESASDRDAVLDDLDASRLDREAAARLQAGEAVSRFADQDEAELVTVRPATGIDTGRAVSDEAVAAHMAPTTAVTRALLPYALCTRAVCQSGCEAGVRANGQRLAVATGAEARRIWTEGKGRVTTLDPIAAELAAGASDEPQLAYCAAVHLAVRGDAFSASGGIDIRPKLAAAVRQATTGDG
jgi:DNA helicase HerA-like ATPase